MSSDSLVPPQRRAKRYAAISKHPVNTVAFLNTQGTTVIMYVNALFDQSGSTPTDSDVCSVHGGYQLKTAPMWHLGYFFKEKKEEEKIYCLVSSMILKLFFAFSKRTSGIIVFKTTLIICSVLSLSSGHLQVRHYRSFVFDVCSVFLGWLRPIIFT